MSKTLVAYFSRRGENYVGGSIENLERGNAELLAGYAAGVTGGDLFEIASVRPYPLGYHECTEVAQEEKRAGARPELTDTVRDMDSYDTVVLIYPNWWGELPMPVFTFLESYDFAGKAIYPCCTHEGSGMSGTDRSVARACPDADVRPGLAIVGSHAPQAQAEVAAWLR